MAAAPTRPGIHYLVAVLGESAKLLTKPRLVWTDPTRLETYRALGYAVIADPTDEREAKEWDQVHKLGR